MKNLLFTLTLLLLAISTYAQHTRFITSGRIEYEKTINMFGLARQQTGKNASAIKQDILDNYLKTQPQFQKLKSELVFSGGQMLFTPADVGTNNRIMGVDNPMAAQINQVYTDLASHTTIIKKNVFEEFFLLKDSTRKINWKITTETRVIAGYLCRRANAVVMDSVYAVAFYTDRIHVPGGPESFNGLPGMILGLALPHENVTWFALKVTDEAIPVTTITAPQKGKNISRKQLLDLLNEKLRGQGQNGRYLLKGFSL